MNRASDTLSEITPDVLLKAYACGIFPTGRRASTIPAFIGWSRSGVA